VTDSEKPRRSNAVRYSAEIPRAPTVGRRTARLDGQGGPGFRRAEVVRLGYAICILATVLRTDTASDGYPRVAVMPGERHDQRHSPAGKRRSSTATRHAPTPPRRSRPTAALGQAGSTRAAASRSEGSLTCFPGRVGVVIMPHSLWNGGLLSLRKAASLAPRAGRAESVPQEAPREAGDRSVTAEPAEAIKTRTPQVRNTFWPGA
jgi:hypothetical protein